MSNFNKSFTIKYNACKAIEVVMASKGYDVEVTETEVKGYRSDESISFSPDLLMELCEGDLSFDAMALEMSIAIDFLLVMNLDRIKPYLITEEERISLHESIYFETLEDGRHIIYHDDLVRRTQPFVTKKEANELPNIRKMAFQNLEVIERFDYSLKGIEGANVSRIIDEDCSIDSRTALLTNNVSKILSHSYQDHAYLVTTPRGDLFAFSIDNDPYQFIEEVMESHVGLLSERFDVIEYHEKHISNHFTITSGRKWS